VPGARPRPPRHSAYLALALTLLRQILTARSIIEVAIRPLKYLTEQAEFLSTKPVRRKRLATFPICMCLAAASPQSQVAEWPHRPIVIWYGEELTQ
jgi:hypothetical protein